MRILTDTAPMEGKFGIREAIRLFKEAGFDALDYSMFSLDRDDSILSSDGWRDYAKELRAFADEEGIPFVQGHSPYPTALWDNADYNARMYPRVIRSIEIAGILGIKNLVVHPITAIPAGPNRKEFNMLLYRDLLPCAKENGVTLCLENMWNMDLRRGYIIGDSCSFGHELADWHDTLADENITVCLDVGHSSLVGEEAEDAIRAIGHRLGALHIHDNDYKSDAHLLPYAGKMHWDKITAALREVGYKGDFTFEACNFFNPLPADRGICLAAARMMCEVGRSLVRQIEG